MGRQVMLCVLMVVIWVCSVGEHSWSVNFPMLCNSSPKTNEQTNEEWMNEMSHGPSPRKNLLGESSRWINIRCPGMTNIYGALSRVIKYSADTFKSALTSSSNCQTAKGDSSLVPDTKPPWATTQPAISPAWQWVTSRKKGVKRKQNRRSNIQKPSVLINTELSALSYGICHQELRWMEKASTWTSSRYEWQSW